MFINQDFTHNRANFLGGSDIGAIVGVSPYRSAIDVWLEKTDKAVRTADGFALRFGSFAESFIAEEFAKVTGSVLAIHEAGIIHPKHPFCVGHIDRFVLERKDEPLFVDGKLNAKSLLECKTANIFSQKDWGEPGTDAVPLPYLCQCLWYLGIAGLSKIDVAVLMSGTELKIYTIERDESLINLLFEKAVFFWEEHVQKDIPPPPQSVSDCQALFAKGSSGKTIEADLKALGLIQNLKELERSSQANGEKIEAIKQQLMQTMADAEMLTYKGQSLVTWKSPKPSYRIDTKRLGLEHPELTQRYQTLVQSSRRFVVKDLPNDLYTQEILEEKEVLVGIAK
jgi:putative phage-type endonuclease